MSDSRVPSIIPGTIGQRELDPNQQLFTWSLADERIYPRYALEDYGSNANGEYVIFSSGLQICWASLTGQTNATIRNVNIGTYGWSYYLDSHTWTFPKTFATAPKVYAGGSTTGPGIANTATTSQCTFGCFGVSNSNYAMDLFAIGQAV